MANHKATGPDSLHVEVFKCDKCLDALLPLLNAMLDSGVVDEALLRATQVPLHKKDSVDELF
jgi:hypothetical protein